MYECNATVDARLHYALLSIPAAVGAYTLIASHFRCRHRVHYSCRTPVASTGTSTNTSSVGGVDDRITADAAVRDEIIHDVPVRILRRHSHKVLGARWCTAVSTTLTAIVTGIIAIAIASPGIGIICRHRDAELLLVGISRHHAGAPGVFCINIDNVRGVVHGTGLPVLVIILLLFAVPYRCAYHSQKQQKHNVDSCCSTAPATPAAAFRVACDIAYRGGRCVKIITAIISGAIGGASSAAVVCVTGRLG